MSIWTKEELQKQIKEYKEALLACTSGKSYSIGSRSLTRSDMQEIKNMLDYFEGELNKINNVQSSFIARAKIHGPFRGNYGS